LRLVKGTIQIKVFCMGMGKKGLVDTSKFLRSNLKETVE